jgi:hypothetical protein
MASADSSPSFRSLASHSSGLRYAVRFLYTHNPLYLISVLFVLHGTARWLPDASGPYNPWPLMGLSFAYILLLALTALAIVRFGQVWQDARSILLILVGLFVELSLTFDDPLTKNLPAGKLVVLAGYGFAVLVSEALRAGLRMRVPLGFRLPFHGMLALLMLYPLLLVRDPSQGDTLAISWRIYLFSPITAVVLVTLLPAIRRGPDYVGANGTPWAWPWFPWVVFGVMGAGLCLRGYVLSLSFDPVLSLSLSEAMQLQSAYGAYYLAPILLSLAVLLLEMGLVSREQRLEGLALATAALCVLVSFTGRPQNAPYAAFLSVFLSQVGSPLFLSVVAAVTFYAYAFARRVRLAEPAFGIALGVASIVGPHTIGLATLTSPQAVPLWLLCGFALWQGVRRGNSLRALVAAAAGVAALGTWPLASVSLPWRVILPPHLGIASVLLIGVFFRDAFARWVRHLGSLLLFLACVSALLVPVHAVGYTSGPIIAVYVASLTTASLVCAYLLEDMSYFWFGLMSVAACASELFWQSYVQLRGLREWRGIRSFAIAFGLLALAAVLSAVKGGIVRKLVQFLPGAARRAGTSRVA